MAESQPLITINAIDEPEFQCTNNGKNSNRNYRFQEPPTKRHRSAQTSEPVQLSPTDRSVLRSHYDAIKTIINGELNVEEKEELCRGDSDRFQKIMVEVNRLHQHVANPREQVKDAETLLELASILLNTVRSYSKDGITPSDFISSLIREFGAFGENIVENDHVSIKWNTIGMLVCPMFKKAQGCPTMIGPMNTQLKERKASARKKRTKLSEIAAKPEQLEDSGLEQKTDTDKNMATMFNILRNKKRVSLENLILNRSSFAQTIENLFALSFLVKDGRAQVVVDNKGTHLVSPKNAPLSNSVTSGEVSYHHFVFRFDYKDWKLMVDSVTPGEELMPYRYQVSIPLSQAPADTLPSHIHVAMVPTTV